MIDIRQNTIATTTTTTDKIATYLLLRKLLSSSPKYKARPLPIALKGRLSYLLTMPTQTPQSLNTNTSIDAWGISIRNASRKLRYSLDTSSLIGNRSVRALRGRAKYYPTLTSEVLVEEIERDCEGRVNIAGTLKRTSFNQ